MLSYGTIDYSGMASLVYSTSFEDAIKVGNKLNLPVAHMFGLQNGGTFWVENTTNPTPGAPNPRTGQKCIGMSLPAGTGTQRSEFAFGFFTNPTWSEIGDELFTSVWLYLPSDWDLHSTGWNWFEIINSFVCTPGMGGDYPRLKWHIDRSGNSGSYFARIFWATDAGEAGVLLREINPFVVPKGEWFNIKTYTYRHETNGTMKVWLTSSYYGTNYVIVDASGYQTKYPGEEDWYTSFAKSYMSGDGYEHKMWVDDVEIWNARPPGF